MDFGGEAVVLAAQLHPLDAMPGISWTISDKKGAFAQYTVDTEKGTLTVVPNETGKLNVVKTVTELNIENQTVRSGKTLNLAKLIQINPGDATNKKLTWKITYGSQYATLSSGGSFKAKKVTGVKVVEVTVTSQDGGAGTVFYVTIMP